MHVTFEGEIAVLNSVLRGTGMSFALVKNNLFVGAEASANFAAMVEADFVGYARINAPFGMAATDGNMHGKDTITVTFTAGALVAPQTVYGLAAIRDIGGGVNKIIGYHNFSTARVFNSPGDSIVAKINGYCDGFDPLLVGPLP